jgi:hypothetical protein
LINKRLITIVSTAQISTCLTLVQIYNALPNLLGYKETFNTENKMIQVIK